MKSGILYITENRSFVQHRKQEFCTTQKTGILYITYMMMSVKLPCVVASQVHGSTRYILIDEVLEGNWTQNLVSHMQGQLIN